MIRLILVDDERLLVDCLTDRLNAGSEFSVIASTGNADEARGLVQELQPDIALLEVELRGGGTFALAADLVSSLRNTRIAFLTSDLSDVFLDEAIRLGAAGYLIKDDPVDTILQHLRRIVDGEQRFSTAARARLQYDERRHRFETRSSSCLTALSHQQLEVLRHLARGDSVKQVAHKVQQSERSVESQKYRIMQSLGLHDRVELTRFAIREGLTVP